MTYADEAITVEEWQERYGGKKHKYNAKKTDVDGVIFDSKREAERYLELKSLEKFGQLNDRIYNLELQPEFILQESFKDRHGRHHRAIKYRADFKYVQNGHTIIEDVKGVETAVFKIKKKLFIKKYPGLILRITK